MTGLDCHTRCFVVAIYALLSFISFTLPSRAQVATTIVPDESVNTTVTHDGSVHTISNGTLLGRNLFHSFEHFSLGTHDIASFANPGGRIENILNRVTGEQPSRIDGTLQSDIPGANLFFLNPHGIVFGPHARLDIRGSLHVSTADALRFADGATWYTDSKRESTLTLAPITAFGFEHSEPAEIAVQGSHLQVVRGKTCRLLVASSPLPEAQTQMLTIRSWTCQVATLTS